METFMETFVITSVIISIFFAIVFLVMASNIGTIKKNLRQITSHLIDQKYIVYLGNTGEWVEYTWEMIGVNVAYIKDLSGVDDFEVRKKLYNRFDVQDSYTILKRFNDIEQAKEYYKSLLKQTKP